MDLTLPSIIIPKIILRLDLGCRRRCPLTSCQITAAEAFPWCQLDMGRVQLFAILPSIDSRNIIGILSIMWRVEYIAAITKDQILFAGLYLV